MSFDNLKAVLECLDRAGPLSDDERRNLYTWLNDAGEHNRHILDIEMTRRLRDALNENRSAIKEFDASTRTSMSGIQTAIEHFDKASARLSKRIYWLTWGVFILTGILVALTILLVVLAKVKS